MTVSSSTDRATFAGNGVAAAFSLPFRFFANSDVVVQAIVDSTGVATPLTLGVDYLLTGAGQPEEAGSATGVLTTSAPVPIGVSLFAQRIIPTTQPTDIVNQGRFFPEVHETVFDRLTMLIQQQQSGLDRAWRWPAASGISGLLPYPVALKIPQVRADLSGIQFVDYQPSVAAGNWPVISNIATLRGLNKSEVSNTFVAGYYSSGDGGGGNYWFDAADTTSVDNGGTIIVAADGGRWKLVLTGGLSARQFGAKGDNATDDYARLQAWLDYAGSNRGLKIFLPSGKFKISQPLAYRPTVVLPAAGSGSEVHFADHVESVIEGRGDARLIATAVMPQMLLLQYGSDSIGPFYTTIQGILFDGASLAVGAIESDYTMHLSILKNKIRGAENGVKFTGYGVAKIRDNVIKASVNCINFSGGGGDSVIESNDFYPLAGAVGVRVGALGGNCSVVSNVFNGEGFADCIGVFLDGVGAGPSNSVINVRVLNNEFSGMAISVYGQRHASARNVFGIVVQGNHTIPAAGGAVHAGNLISFNGVDDSIITDNLVNGISILTTISSTPGMQIIDCLRPIISSNKFGNLLGPAAYFLNTVDGDFINNEIIDVGRAGSGGVMVDIDNGTTYMRFLENRLVQSSASYAQNPFYERSGANGNEILRNNIRGAGRSTRVGSSSVVAGRTIATGSYSLSGGVATLQNNSHGFTVARTAVGVCTVTLPVSQTDSDFRVKITADAPQVGMDTFTENSFVVRTFTAAGVAVDAIRVQLEVIN